LADADVIAINIAAYHNHRQF